MREREMYFLTRYEMTAVIGARAEHIHAGDASFLSSDDLQRVDPAGINHLAQAEEELRQRKLDHIMVRRPSGLVPISHLDLDIVPNMPRKNICGRRGVPLQRMEVDPEWVNPYGDDGRLPYGGVHGGHATLELERPFRVFPCDFIDGGIGMPLVCTRARTYSGEVIEHTVDGSPVRSVVLYVSRVMDLGTGRPKRLHIDGSLETWIRMRCSVFTLSRGREVHLRITHVGNASRERDALKGALHMWHERNRLKAEAYAMARLTINDVDVPGVTVFFGYDASTRTLKHTMIERAYIKDVISTSKQLSGSDDNPASTDTTLVATLSRTELED